MISGAALRYLALGDSYTIGTGASHPSRNFPNQLARRLEAATGRAVEVRNPAVHGYTTADLIREELPALEAFRPDLVTVLIGVNDLVAGIEQAAYRSNLRLIYAAIERQVRPEKVAAISIPDFSIAKAAARFGSPDALKAQVESSNEIARDESSEVGFRYLDLVGVSRSRSSQPGWFAADDLHPADSQYAAWAAWIWERVQAEWVGIQPGR